MKRWQDERDEELDEFPEPDYEAPYKPNQS